MWKDAVKHCENLELAGYSDWEMPSVEAIKPLYYGRRNIQCSTVAPDVPCHIHYPFELTTSGVWSSSSGMKYGYYKIFVFVRDGFVRHRNGQAYNLKYPTLCVRYSEIVDVEEE